MTLHMAYPTYLQVKNNALKAAHTLDVQLAEQIVIKGKLREDAARKHAELMAKVASDVRPLVVGGGFVDLQYVYHTILCLSLFVCRGRRYALQE